MVPLCGDRLLSHEVVSLAKRKVPATKAGRNEDLKLRCSLRVTSHYRLPVVATTPGHSDGPLPRDSQASRTAAFLAEHRVHSKRVGT